MENINREIIVYKLYPQNNSGRGYLRAVAESNGKQYIALNSENFCITGKVFVTSDYDKIDDNYRNGQLFKITISESQINNLELPSDKNCKYVSRGSKHIPLKPREFVELIAGDLPNPNEPIVDYERLPSTDYIYLYNKKECFGPFKWDFQEDCSKLLLKKIDTPLPGRSLNIGSIFSGILNQLTEHKLSCSLPEGHKFFFTDLTALHNNASLASIDFSSDIDLINLFSKIAKELHYNNVNKKIDFHYLESQIKKNSKFNQKTILEKFQKFKDIANQNYNFKDEILDGFEKFLKSPMGDRVIASYISTHKNEYLKEIKENHQREIEIDLKDKKNELLELQDKIETNKKELIELGKEIEDRNNLKYDTVILDNSKKYSDLETEIALAKLELKELNSEYNTLSNKHLKLKSYDQILKDLEDAQNKYKYEMSKQIEIKNETKKLSNLYRQDEENLRQKLFELKPFVEAINGNIASNRQNHSISVELQPNNKNINNSDSIINKLEELLKEKGRSLSHIEIINLTITIQQSFLCFLAGLPGGGKTTLVRLLADVAGIRSKRFLEIPVARGWSGQKDLIGYFNPISNKFQSSNTGMYDFLNALHQDSIIEGEKTLSYILLDEANLSPIEHYWSSFMGISDIKDTKDIRLGEDKLIVPDNLRFIATINYDNTTEFLSHRILDRAPVIILDNNELINPNELLEQSDKSSIDMPISYKIMNNFFGLTTEIPDFTQKEQRIITEIRNLLEDKDIELGKPLKISNRKEIAIRQYCSKARPLMRTYSDDDDLLAIDYAILQLILPQIRGNGKKFGTRLNKLSDILNKYELDRSSEWLDNIIKNGAHDLYTFDFFCW
jgi:hypothetical protein